MLKFLARIKPKPKQQHWEDYFHGREELLWEGHPAPGIHKTPGMVFVSIFGLPFFIVGAGMIIASLSGMFTGGLANFGGGLFMIIFALPFAIIGFGLAFGSWILSYYSHQFVRYAISNKRAYIAKSWWSHTMESYPITSNAQIELKEGKFDTVYFFTEITRDSDGDRHQKSIGFEHIENGMTVYKLLRDVQAKALERDQGMT